MPATRSKKGKKAAPKKAAAARSKPVQVGPEEVNEDESTEMRTDEQPAPSASNLAVQPSAEVEEPKALPFGPPPQVDAVEQQDARTIKDAIVVEPERDVNEEAMTGIETSQPSSSNSPNGAPALVEGGAPKLTMEERRSKLAELRKKMAISSKANRASLIEEASKAKITARDAARLERQRKLAETLRLKADAEERGEDIERQKNWEYTIEENDEWEKKLARKRRRADFEFHDDAHAARRRYKKDLDLIKPNLDSYNKQKAFALGLNNGKAGALVGFSATGSSDLAITNHEQRLAAEDLYRDANTLIYGDNKPSEEAIDKVVSKVNKDIEKKGKFHRKRLNEEEGDITYINEHNRVFNKKIARYYDKYTADIRASFERGTAL